MSSAEELIRVICWLLDHGCTAAEIGKVYGLPQWAVYHISIYIRGQL